MSEPVSRRKSLVNKMARGAKAAAGSVSRGVSKIKKGRNYSGIDGDTSSNEVKNKSQAYSNINATPESNINATPERDGDSPQSPSLSDNRKDVKIKRRLTLSSNPDKPKPEERKSFALMEHNTSGANKSYGTITA